MPVPNYGLLSGRLLEGRREDGRRTPHFQAHLLAAGTHYRLAVNVESALPPHALLFHVDEDFRHPVTAPVAALPDGFHPAGGGRDGPALDYLRGGLFDRRAMRPLPPSLPGRDNDVADRLGRLVARAVREPGARVHAFGSRWGPEPRIPDASFRFLPGNGLHNIHMNQGNAPGHEGDDGVRQDGGLLFFFPAAGRWAALFLAFQSQAWATDDRTGSALAPAGDDGAADQAPAALRSLAKKSRRIASRSTRRT
jgi:uncharacterized protein YukJ